MNSTSKKLNPYGLAFWNKSYVLPEEIEVFTGGVVDYPTVAAWEAEDRLQWHPGFDCMAASVNVPSAAYPEKVVLFGYVSDFQVQAGRFGGVIRDPLIAYEVGSLWDWLVRRVGLEQDEDFSAQESCCSNPETVQPF